MQHNKKTIFLKKTVLICYFLLTFTDWCYIIVMLIEALLNKEEKKMFKKAISLLLSLMLIVTSLSVTVLSVSAAGSTYVVAGVPEICGTEWDASAETSPDNVMTAKGDGTYEKVFTDVAVGKDYQVKVAETTADGAQNWYGLNGGQDNITFNVTSVCDVTVTFDPQTLVPTVSGDGVEMVTDINVESMRVVGNGAGNGNWLNGVDWDPASDAKPYD